MLREAVVGEIVCISLPDRPHEPWMIGELQHAPLPATEADVAEAKALGFTVKVGASVLRLTKYEPFEFGSRKFIQTKVPLVVPSGRLRRHQLLSNEPRPRLTAKMKAESRFCDTTFELKEADLRAIVALVTSERGTIGDFKVDSILDHRIVVQRGKPVDQFKTKWAGWDRCEDLTWEPLAHFESEAHIARCNALISEKAAATAAAAKTAEAPGAASSSTQSAAEDAKVAVGSKPGKQTAQQQAKLAAKQQAQLDREEVAAIKASQQKAAAVAAASAADAASPAVGVAGAAGSADAGVPDAGAADAASAAADAAPAPAIADPPADQPAEGAKAPPVRYDSIGDMLSLAKLAECPVVGDGNCGFYAFLAADGQIEHCRRRRLGTPSVADYSAQQSLRCRCYDWLTDGGSALSKYMHTCDGHMDSSSWAPAMLTKIIMRQRAFGPSNGLLCE